MRNFPDLSLYVIIDTGYLKKIRRNYSSVLAPALKAGATAVQLRAKGLDKRAFLKLAKKIKKITRSFRVPFIINDSAPVAAMAGADGVHLGMEDMKVQDARRLLGRDSLIGISASDEKQARLAARSGADYMGLGPVFKTQNKKTRPMPAAMVKRIIRGSRMPIVAIGGIKEYNIRALKKTGIKNFCFISEVAGAVSVYSKVKKLKELIDDPA
jgi:thiamine-phosphate pyrophosphorylase